MTAPIRMRLSNSSSETPRLLAHWRRKFQLSGVMLLWVRFIVMSGVLPRVFVVTFFRMVDSSSLTGIGVGCVRAGKC